MTRRGGGILAVRWSSTNAVTNDGSNLSPDSFLALTLYARRLSTKTTDFLDVNLVVTSTFASARALSEARVTGPVGDVTRADRSRRRYRNARAPTMRRVAMFVVRSDGAMDRCDPVRRRKRIETQAACQGPEAVSEARRGRRRRARARAREEE